MSVQTNGSAPRRIFIDKQSPDAFHALVQASKAVRGVAADAGLDRATVELINLRVSQLNGCAYCLALHTEAALRAGESPLRLGVLAAWRDTGMFTPPERAALALAEATTDATRADAQSSAYEVARQVLSDDQVSAAIWVAITINSFNRVSIMSGHPVPTPGTASPEGPAGSDDHHLPAREARERGRAPTGGACAGYRAAPPGP